MAASYPGSTGSTPQPPTRYQPHHATAVLVMGIASIFTAGTIIIGMVLGIIAWIVGGQDLQGMDRGHVDPRGRGSVNTGRVCGLIGAILSGMMIFVLIIGAILFPVFASARFKAREASCLSNIKQLDLGILMYAADHNNRLPNAATWTQDIQPYVKNPALLHCADDTSGARSSYAMNAVLSGADSNKLMDSASEVVLLYETNQPGDSPSGDASTVAPRHNGGSNYGFLDGHVKWANQPPPFGGAVAPSKSTATAQ